MWKYNIVLDSIYHKKKLPVCLKIINFKIYVFQSLTYINFRFRQMQETENESILDGKNLEEMLNLTLNDEDLLTESTIE